ncbi:MAG: diaminopimelate dehydrogenase [Defluviitaleaceae bacterium]|nr:diaminopimelate dehydrogenase [Defluviitaleaceae bacterium]
MRKIRVAIVGYGNIGKGVYEAITASPDMELAGVILRDVKTAQVKGVPVELKVAEKINDLGKVDVALLCIPSRSVEATAAKLLSQGIHTVDSYDIHGDIYDVGQRLSAIGKAHNAVSVMAAGWDPGTDSMVRAILEAAAPKGLTYTNFGPGMSMGHTVVAKSKAGVKNALSVTIPSGTGLHRRMVYIQPEVGANFAEITTAIKSDPYFSNDDTHVVLAEDIDALQDKGHGVNMVRKGVSGTTDNQLFEFNMTINNPALTAQIMVSAARAATRQSGGCYTLLEVPIIDMLPGNREAIIRRLV